MGKRLLFCILATINFGASVAIMVDVDHMEVKVLMSLLAVVLFVDGMLQGITRTLIFIGALMNFMLLWNTWSPQPIANIGAMLLFAGHWGALLGKDSP